MVSGEIFSTNPSSMALLASMRSVHWSCPSGTGQPSGGDKVRLLRPRERLAIASLAFLARHHIHPAFGEAGAHCNGRVAADVERVADLDQAPALSQFEQDLRARPGAFLPAVEEGVQAGANRGHLTGRRGSKSSRSS